MQFLLRVICWLLGLYFLLSAAIFAVMHLPPERFASVMARLPGPLPFLLPFEPLWTLARSGNLKTGDAAPDFRLRALDKSSEVRLSSFRGERPVVLVFGSYT